MAERRRPPLWAGFDPGRLPWNGHDLIIATGHVAGGGMEAHYERAVAAGATGARDGLTWRHDVASRVAAAPDGFPVVWDMVHFDMPPDPEAHAAVVGSALRPGDWCIAVNEPTVHAHPHFQGDGQSWPFVETALRMMRVAPHLRYATCDALHDLDPTTWWATDRLVESGLIGLVGVNYYPHAGRVPLSEVLREARARYPGMPLAVTETGWHTDHPDLPAGERRRDWLQEVMDVAEGVEWVCWYPWLDMPCWNGTGASWPCGYPYQDP